MNTHYNTIIIGAGASGLMCAKLLHQKTLVLDFADTVARKVKISGGGKCNFTNKNISYENYISSNPNFCRSALSKFTQENICLMLDAEQIPYEQRPDGKFFSYTSSDIVKFLLNNNSEIKTNTEILNINKTDQIFIVNTTTTKYTCTNLVIASGGLSIPQLKVSDFGYKIAEQFGLQVIPPEPALVRLDFKKSLQKRFKQLAGISIFAKVTLQHKTFTGNILFTHYGLSGPSILQASLYWYNNQVIKINFCPNISWKNFWEENKTQKLHNALAKILPARAVPILCEYNNENITNISNKHKDIIQNNLSQFKCEPIHVVGFEKAEATKGGVDTRFLSSKTMEAKTVKSLYFIGEVVDVTGEVGGYNLHWAFASAFSAADSINNNS